MVLNETYPPDIRVRKEAESLHDAGYDVVLLCKRSTDEPARERVGAIDVVRVPVYERYGRLSSPINASYYLGQWVDLPWQRAIADFYETDGFDALHVHDLPLVKTALRWTDDSGVPVVADLHENWPEAVRQYRTSERVAAVSGPKDAVERLSSPIWRLKRIERACVTGVDRVVAVVTEGKTHYVRDCGADPDDVVVVPNYVDHREFRERDPQPAAVDGEFVMLYVGTIGGRHRGLETVLRAMPTIAAQVANPKFLVVGSGPYTGRLEELSRELGITDLVTFTGWVDFEDLPRYVAASDVGLVPHRNNPHTATTIPHKLTQYMAMGTPVITSDVPPLERLVTDAEAGRVFPAGDPDGLAAVAVELGTHPDLRARLGNQASRAVETHYNWRTAGARVCDLYDGLLGTQDPNSGANL